MPSNALGVRSGRNRTKPALEAEAPSALTAWALERARGSRRIAAELLGVHPATIERRRWLMTRA